LLLAHGAQVSTRDKSGRTALHWAASLRDPQSLKVLLRHKAAVNLQDKAGATALMLASVKPDKSDNTVQNTARLVCIKILKSFGARTDLKDKNGKTSVDYSRMVDSDFISAG
jgi:ankyrin repeat protein